MPEIYGCPLPLYLFTSLPPLPLLLFGQRVKTGGKKDTHKFSTIYGCPFLAFELCCTSDSGNNPFQWIEYCQTGKYKDLTDYESHF